MAVLILLIMIGVDGGTGGGVMQVIGYLGYFVLEKKHLETK
jgi:hypothetical protein